MYTVYVHAIDSSKSLLSLFVLSFLSLSLPYKQTSICTSLHTAAWILSEIQILESIGYLKLP